MKQARKIIKRFPYKTVNVDNGCMVNSVRFRDVVKAEKLLGQEHQAKILNVQVTRTEGHAVCVFEVDGEWFVYDIMCGTYSIGKFDKVPALRHIVAGMQVQQDKDVVISKPEWSVK